MKHSHIHMLLLEPAGRCLPAPLSKLQPTCADLASSGDFTGGFSYVPQLEGLFSHLTVCFCASAIFSVGFLRKQGLCGYPVFVHERERDVVSF